MRHAILAALLGATLIAGCGGDDTTARQGTAATTATTARSASPTDTIRIRDFLFEPSPATIAAGQKITVPNDDAAPHTLTDRPAAGEPQFDTGTLRGKQRGSFAVPKPGTYKIFCEIHPFMKGEIKVVAS